MAVAATDPLNLELERHRLHLAMWKATVRSIRASDGSDSAIRATLREVCSHLHWPVGAFYAVDETGAVDWNSAKVRADPDAPSESVRQVTGPTLEPAGDPRQRAVKRGEADWIIDVTRDPEYAPTKAAVALGLRGHLAVPVRDGDRVRGVLAFYSAQPMEPRPDLLEVLGEIAHQLNDELRHRTLLEALRLARNGHNGRARS